MKFTPQRMKFIHSIDGVNYSLDFLESIIVLYMTIFGVGAGLLYMNSNRTDNYINIYIYKLIEEDSLSYL